jgi:hypothetical protein
MRRGPPGLPKSRAAVFSWLQSWCMRGYNNTYPWCARARITDDLAPSELRRRISKNKVHTQPKGSLKLEQSLSDFNSASLAMRIQISEWLSMLDKTGTSYTTCCESTPNDWVFESKSGLLAEFTFRSHWRCASRADQQLSGLAICLCYPFNSTDILYTAPDC